MKGLTAIIERLFFERRKRINAPRQIFLSFLIMIAAGTLLLMCPFSTKSGEGASFFDALFTAASASCVTGLVVVDTGAYYSFFGQLVILILIQMGGLGFMTILSMALLQRNKRMNVRSKIAAAQSLNIGFMSDTAAALSNIIRFTVIIEGAGALILAARFIPKYNLAKGLWYGIFHSVSAFCNAGFDVLGTGDSLMGYNGDILVMLTVSLLIVAGGIGVLVLGELKQGKKFKRLSLYSRMVIVITLILILSGTILFFLFERQNVNTIGTFPIWRKWLNSFFQSVTCRTAGFDAIGQAALTEQSKLISICLMMIGGASGSTAGGIKVVTAGVVVLMVAAALRARDNVVICGRRIPNAAINNAVLLVVMWVILVSGAALFVSFYDGVNLIDSLYEIASAYDTAGLSVGITGGASAPVRILLIIYMFFGRVGVMTISVVFISRSSVKERIDYPDAKIIVG